MTDRDKLDLDSLFAQAREQPPAPDAVLMGLVLRDAYSRQERKPLPFRLRISTVWARLGAVGGLATAAVMGLWIGIGLPSDVTAVFTTNAGQAEVVYGALQRSVLLPDSDILALAGE